MNSSLKSSLAQTHYKTGNSCLARGEHLAAIKNYQQAISIKPDYFKAFCNLGVAYKNLQIFAKSEEAFKRALALNSKDPIVFNNLGNLYLDARKYFQAEKAYLQALRLSPEYRDVLYNLEQLYNAVGKPSKAVEYRVRLEQLFRKEPLSDISNVIIAPK